VPITVKKPHQKIRGVKQLEAEIKISTTQLNRSGGADSSPPWHQRYDQDNILAIGPGVTRTQEQWPGLVVPELMSQAMLTPSNRRTRAG
jgi:hypothetical protein